MFKILKYLKDSKLSVLAITILLVAQALCDLALPQYTADIVDVGIGQYGIRYAAPEKLRAESMEALCGMLSEADAERVRSFYEKEDGIYVRNSDAKKDLEELDSILTGPMAQAVLLQRMQQAAQDGADVQVQSAMALMYVQQEYEALGMDLGSLQTQYLLTTGGKMLLLSLLMMATAILVSLLASRVAASIGKNLRKHRLKKSFRRCSFTPYDHACGNFPEGKGRQLLVISRKRHGFYGKPQRVDENCAFLLR